MSELMKTFTITSPATRATEWDLASNECATRKPPHLCRPSGTDVALACKDRPAEKGPDRGAWTRRPKAAGWYHMICGRMMTGFYGVSYPDVVSTSDP
jgi:hypothetical protein